MPVRPLLLGMKFAIRVGHLPAQSFLEIKCEVCGHTRRAAPWTLHERFDAESRLVDVERRWRCPRCGQLGRQSWVVMEAVPPAVRVPETGMQRVRRERREEAWRQRAERMQPEDGGGDDAA